MPPTLNRRSFCLSVAAAMSTKAVSVLWGAESRRFKAGFLGLAHSHAKEKLRLVQGHPNFELIGAAEPSEQVRKGFPAVRWMEEGELLDSCEVVFVESEVRHHARHALRALRAGKHVHLEKPPCVRYEEMVEITQAAQERQLLVQCGYMWRHHPGFQAIFQAVRAGWLGEVFQVRGTMNNSLAEEERPTWAEFKGGAFFELAAHLVDATVRLLGKPNRVSPFLSSTKGDALVDNNVVVFEFPGATAVITNSTNQPNAFAHRSFEVLGNNGTMTLRPIEPPTLQVDLAEPRGPYKAGLQTVPLPKYARYVGDIDAFAAALRGESPLPVSPAEDLMIQEWLLRACGMM